MAETSTSTAARPYAKAAFEFARGQQALEAWSGMLSTAANVAVDATVKAVLDNPKLSTEHKVDTFIDVCGDALDDNARNFIRTLGAQHRLAALPSVAELFEAQKAEQEQRVEVTLVSAFALESEQEEKLATALRKRLNRDISITTQVDSTLLGGVIIRAGDTVIDGSVRGKLARLSEALNS
ncbi:F0F1 ATP synthase subunit delta [Aeromonas hydrophila]|uniref:F0F1 ATP synthase subunit delta n=1 Tax=Aeromonas hydrophila TaxID=644 RepID=UPI0008085809|nr:F0F1 ATP synthase subunit delta [Aeromonas hydrophila]OCA59979.1 ATP synthase F1 subunit delta [Aeromonas hydrophila]